MRVIAFPPKLYCMVAAFVADVEPGTRVYVAERPVFVPTLHVTETWEPEGVAVQVIAFASVAACCATAVTLVLTVTVPVPVCAETPVRCATSKTPKTANVLEKNFKTIRFISVSVSRDSASSIGRHAPALAQRQGVRPSP